MEPPERPLPPPGTREKESTEKGAPVDPNQIGEVISGNFPEGLINAQNNLGSTTSKDVPVSERGFFRNKFSRLNEAIAGARSWFFHKQRWNLKNELPKEEPPISVFARSGGGDGPRDPDEMEVAVPLPKEPPVNTPADAMAPGLPRAVAHGPTQGPK